MATADLRTTPQQPRSEETIESILDAAEIVFDAKGLDNGTTSEIASAANISVGRVYYWFASKDAIVDGLVDRAQQLLRQTFIDVVSTRENYDRSTSTERLLRATVELARTSPAVALVLQGNSRGILEGHRKVHRQFVRTAAATYEEHFGIGTKEALLVGEASVSVSWSALPQLLAEEGDDLLREIVYAQTCYLSCRFPPADFDPSVLVDGARPGPYDRENPPIPMKPVTYIDLTDKD